MKISAHKLRLPPNKYVKQNPQDMNARTLGIQESQNIIFHKELTLLIRFFIFFLTIYFETVQFVHFSSTYTVKGRVFPLEKGFLKDS